MSDEAAGMTDPLAPGAGDDVPCAALPAVPPEAAPVPLPPARASLWKWLREGARAALFLAPRWERVHVTPLLLALLVVLELCASIAIDRLYLVGDASFNWRPALAGSSYVLLLAWASYCLRPQPGTRYSAANAPSASHLLALLLSLGLVISVVYGLSVSALVRLQLADGWPSWAQWTAFLLPMCWVTLATLVAMVRSGDRMLSRQVPAIYALGLACTIAFYLAPHEGFWRAAVSEEEQADEGPEPMVFDQELVEAQAPLLASRIGALAPQRPGVIDMYTITFAPYEGEEVFRRESRMVSEVMNKRFDATGRNVQLLNHRDHLDNMPWATPLNLRRTLAALANTMDREEDVLFIHLTSHGARNGELATNFWPFNVDPVTPQNLRKWLDEAGIRHRVISISACFSGSWIAPLASDDTLVMSASDANHTSYGCGKLSPLTFFGRAMYDEQLRSTTRSFEKAHAAARIIIAKREKEAGKDDGYSNPQIKVGSRIGPYLERLRARIGN